MTFWWGEAHGSGPGGSVVFRANRVGYSLGVGRGPQGERVRAIRGSVEFSESRRVDEWRRGFAWDFGSGGTPARYSTSRLEPRQGSPGRSSKKHSAFCDIAAISPAGADHTPYLFRLSASITIAS